MTCLVIDDEELARKLLLKYIGDLPELECLADFKNAMDARASLPVMNPDLLFLDINMPGLSGLEFLRTLKQKPMVVLTTAYTEHALEGFELDVIDYLVKPFSFERFVKAVNKASEYSSYRQPSSRSESHFYVKSDYKIVRIEFDDVIFVEGMREYVRIITKEKKIMTLLSMNKVEEALPGDRFLRVHRSFVINLNKIRAVHNNEIEMDGIKIPVGANYKQALMDVLRAGGLF